MTDEITRTGCDEEEYVAIPKSEYEHLKAVKAKYISNLKTKEEKLLHEVDVIRQQMNVPIPPTIEEIAKRLL